MPAKSKIRVLLFGLIFSTAFTIIYTVKNISNQGKAVAASTTVTFQPSVDEFPNPERGFMKQSSIFVDQPLDTAKVRAIQSTDTVVWIYFRLDNYRDPRDAAGVTLSDYQGKFLEPLGSGKGLDTVKTTFDTARSKNLKLIIRFIYNWGPGSTADPMQATPDMPLDWALRHLNQVTPLIVDNKDVILAVQVGFVGHWGEWHSSKYMNDVISKKTIFDAVLAAVPKDRMVMVRYPRYKQKFYGGPITDAQAYGQTDVTRIGFHDDAFLSDDNDQGTFRSSSWGVKLTTYCDGYPAGEFQCWRDYVNSDSRYSPVGGEASVPNSPRSDCPNALVQLANMHWSFQNNDYNTTLLNSWVTQGCMPEVRRRLGYRFVLKSLTTSAQVNPGGVLPIQLSIENQGFAAAFNPRPVILVLKEKSSGQVTEISLSTVDPRRWLPGQINVNTQVTIPSNLPSGNYYMYLWLPDASTSLKSRSEYAIRMANLNVWQPTSGYNLLLDNLLVSGTILPTVSPTPFPNISPTRTPTPVSATNPVAPTRTPTPSAGCSRKFQGDANCDGLIDLIDFEIWRREFTGTATTKNADYNVDGLVNLIDFEIWRRSFAG